MSWSVSTLALAPLQIIDGDRGKAYPKNTDYSPEGHCLFLNAGNVTAAGFEFSERMFVSEQKDDELRKGKLTRNDIVLTTRGTLGNVAFYEAGIEYEHVRINSGMVIFRCDSSKLLPEFLYGYLRSPSFGNQVEQLRSGAAQPQLPIRDLSKIEIALPPVYLQRKVVDVFSNYDKLIENNRRRMALLEDSARLLYREWFVRLRFPGYEHTPVVDGVPQGWTRKTLGDSIKLNYGKALKAETRIEGEFPVYGSSGIVGTHEKPLVQGPAIVLGRKGNVGSVFWSSKSFFPIDTVYFVDAQSSSLYLYYALKNMHFISTDVAVPGLNRDFAYSRFLLHPPAALLRAFLDTVVPVQAQLDKLTEVNQKLRAARDLLLPRLMGGEIAV